MAQAGKYGQLEVPGIPDDEPVFVIRARDPEAITVLENYMQDCQVMGSPAAHLEGVSEVLNRFVAWQIEHGTQIAGRPA